MENEDSISIEVKKNSFPIFFIVFGIIIILSIISGIIGVSIYLLAKDNSKNVESDISNDIDSDSITYQNIKKDIPSNYKLFDHDEYSIIYPEDWFVEKGSINFFSKEKLYTNKVGTFNNSFNVVNIPNMGTRISRNVCDSLGENIIPSYKSVYDEIKLEKSEMLTINGQKTCWVSFSVNQGELNVILDQYMYVSKDNETALSITFGFNTEDTEEREEIIDNVTQFFEVK